MCLSADSSLLSHSHSINEVWPTGSELHKVVAFFCFFSVNIGTCNPSPQCNYLPATSHPWHSIDSVPGERYRSTFPDVYDLFEKTASLTHTPILLLHICYHMLGTSHTVSLIIIDHDKASSQRPCGRDQCEDLL